MARLGPYELLEEIGRGGLGVVHRALAPDGRPVAIKLLLSGTRASTPQRRRFQREVEALRRLRHPQVVSLLDAGEERGAPWLVTEWIPGESLAARLERLGPLEPRAAARLVARLARALAACHAAGVLHRDLKPGNVLLRAPSLDADDPVLIDFGLAADLELSRSALTLTGQLVGSPAWWPPEQARGELGGIGPHSDVYGLGAILYAALTAMPVHAGASLAATLEAVERGPIPPRTHAPGLPAALETICLRALALAPAERWPSAQALAEALEAWLAVSQARPPARRARAPLALAVGALVVPPAALLLLRGAKPTTVAPEPPITPSHGGSALPVSPPGVDPDALVEEAAQATRKGTLRPALELLDRALAAHPDHRRALSLRGWVGSLLGDHQGAIRDYRALLERAPEDVDMRGNLGDSLRKAGQLEAGLAELDRALALQPDHAGNLGLRAAARQALGQTRSALDDCDRSLALRPDDVRTLLLRGELRRGLGDAAGAEADVERAVALDPRDMGARRARSWLRIERGDAPGTVEDLDAYLTAVQDDPLAWSDRGFARRLLEDYAGALEDYDRALALRPDDPKVLCNRGTALRLLKRPAEALVDLERVLALVPPDEVSSSSVAARWQRALTLLQLKRVEPARADVEQVLRLQPQHLEALHLRAALRLDAGDRAGADADLEEILRLAPDHPVARDAREQLEELRAGR